MRKLIYLCMLLALLCAACVAQKRWVTLETLWPGEPYVGVVELPEGTKMDDVMTTMIDNKLMVVFPVSNEVLSKRSE